MARPREMSQAERIRALAAKGHTAPEIVRILNVPRPSVLSALRHTGPRGRPSEGKEHQVTLRMTAELMAAVTAAQQEGEPLSGCLVRLIKRGLR